VAEATAERILGFATIQADLDLVGILEQAAQETKPT
jgi:hypothetical protein